MDLITFCQEVHDRVVSGDLFGFRAERFTREGVEFDPLRDRQTRLGLRWGTRWFSKCYSGVVGRVHLHDSMLMNDSLVEIAHYIKVGESAMRNMQTSLKAASRSFCDIEDCLDMACGYGRVLRLLQTRIAPGKIIVCDIVEEAVKFCQEEFGVRPLLSGPDLMQLSFPGQYDLIWVGSLFTHLKPADGLLFIDHLVASLKPGGVLVFSSQGPTCLVHIPIYGFMFEDKVDDASFVRRIQTPRRSVRHNGSAYDHEPEYGHPASVVPDRSSPSTSSHDEKATRQFDPDSKFNRPRRCWDGLRHGQDLWAFQKLEQRARRILWRFRLWHCQL